MIDQIYDICLIFIHLLLYNQRKTYDYKEKRKMLIHAEIELSIFSDLAIC